MKNQNAQQTPLTRRHSSAVLKEGKVDFQSNVVIVDRLSSGRTEELKHTKRPGILCLFPPRTEKENGVVRPMHQ